MNAIGTSIRAITASAHCARRALNCLTGRIERLARQWIYLTARKAVATMAANVPERCPGCGALLEGRSPYLPSYGRYECGAYADPRYETIECVRRQRDAARAEAERWKQQYVALLDEIERLRREREKIVDGETHFALYHPDFDWWECQACRFLWEFESGDPYEHDMRFCPRCGRRIVREEQHLAGAPDQA